MLSHSIVKFGSVFNTFRYRNTRFFMKQQQQRTIIKLKMKEKKNNPLVNHHNKQNIKGSISHVQNISFEKLLTKDILCLIRDYLVCDFLKNEEEDPGDSLRPIVNEMERYEMYEGNRSWRNFLSASNGSIWKVMRKETRIFALNNHYSFMFSLDKSFQDIVLHRVKDSHKQISLHFTDNKFESFLEEAREKHISIPHLLQNLHCLDCSNNSNLESLPEVTNIHTVLLKGCSNLIEFSAAEIKSLNLFGCFNLLNLSLRSCEQLLELKLIGCPLSSFIKGIDPESTALTHESFVEFFSQFPFLRTLHIHYHPPVMSSATFWQSTRSTTISFHPVSVFTQLPSYQHENIIPSNHLFHSLRELCLTISPDFSPNEKLENILLPTLPLPLLESLELRGIILLSLMTLRSLRSLKITKDPSDNFLAIDSSNELENYQRKLLDQLTDSHSHYYYCCCPELSSFSYRNQHLTISKNLSRHFQQFSRLKRIDFSYSQFQDDDDDDDDNNDNRENHEAEEFEEYKRRMIDESEEEQGKIHLPNSIDSLILPYTEPYSDCLSIDSKRLDSYHANHSFHFHQLDLSATPFPIEKHLPLPSAFQFITKVLLEECELSDISSLSHVPYLSLAYCKGISDYSMLGRQQYLNLKQNNELLSTDLKYLGNIPYLNISECDSLTSIPQDSLINNLYVIADSCNQLKYVEWAGKNYVKVSLDYNRLIVVVTGIIQVLSLEGSYVSFQESPHEHHNLHHHHDQAKDHVDAKHKKSVEDMTIHSAVEKKKDRKINFLVGKYTMF